MNDTIHPESSAQASGRFVLRIEPRLHAELRDAARRRGVSLNEYCARKLDLPACALGVPVVEVVKRALALVGDQLVGVSVFGSWARDEQSERSDVDILVVVGGEVRITRQLYQSWDAAEPLDWGGHPVEPHFVRLPEAGARISSIWAEVAIDGVVLFDRDLSLSKRLAEIRRRIVAGEIVRRRAHGQPCWVGAA